MLVRVVRRNCAGMTRWCYHGPVWRPCRRFTTQPATDDEPYLCPQHYEPSMRTECARLGHDWSPWDMAFEGGFWHTLVRDCKRCGAREVDE